MPSKIEWTDETWNPVTGCSKISAGCKNCYAERIARRLAGRYGYPKDDPFRVTFHPDRLNQPEHWRKPRRVFVCSMGDLFHKIVEVDGYAITEIFSTIMDAPQHTYLFLTKRPRNMRAAIYHFFDGLKPPKNWWFGVTAENQETADERIPVLLEIPAEVRFVSVEPMLGPVDLTQIGFPHGGCENVLNTRVSKIAIRNGVEKLEGINWVICGGESGPGARPMHPDWARWLRDQCVSAGVPFFFKQWGEWGANTEPVDLRDLVTGDFETVPAGSVFKKIGKKAAGRELDGRTWDDWPRRRE